MYGIVVEMEPGNVEYSGSHWKLDDDNTSSFLTYCYNAF